MTTTIATTKTINNNKYNVHNSNKIKNNNINNINIKNDNNNRRINISDVMTEWRTV